MIENIVAGLVALALVAYLVYALVQAGPVLMGDTVAGLLTIGVLVLPSPRRTCRSAPAWRTSSPTDRHWRVERRVYRLVGWNPDQEQRWTAYAPRVVAFSVVGILLLFL